MSESLFLGLDVGTQGVKAILLDPTRGPTEVASRPLDTIRGLPLGHSEQHPADWLHAVRDACADLDAAARARVAAVGVSGQQHGLVPLDAAGDVIRPAKLWNDVSSAAQCEEIVAELGGIEALFARTGNALPPGFTAGKVRWLFEHEPENFARLARILLPHDYVNLWLTGEATCEAGDASGTGFFDVRERRFDPAVLAATAPGLDDKLPRLLDAGEPAGRLREVVADELGLPAGALVSAGGGDNMMAALGAGAAETGVVVLSLGTSGTVFAHADEPVCDPGGELAAFCGSGDRGWLPLGCTMNATVSTELARGLLGMSLDELERALASAEPGAGGVVCVPFFTGERSPNLPDATGGFLGLTPANASSSNLARAAAEGATFALVRLLDRLRALGVEARELRLTGGGSNSPTWARIVAATAGLPVRTGVHPDSAALGAAVQACWTWRREREPALTAAACRRELELDRGLVIVEVDREWHAAYTERRRAYDAAVAALIPVFGELR